MPTDQNFNAGDFADRLAAMTDDELFSTMRDLEENSEYVRPEERDASDVCEDRPG